MARRTASSEPPTTRFAVAMLMIGRAARISMIFAALESRRGEPARSCHDLTRSLRRSASSDDSIAASLQLYAKDRHHSTTSPDRKSVSPLT
jgi:hypothetical protein